MAAHETLNEYYEAKKVHVDEGHCGQLSGQQQSLRDIIASGEVTTVMEIGFNGGHSSELFLSLDDRISVVSFDIGLHEYVEIGKEFIDLKYPGRHHLVLGDSVETVVEYAKNNKNTKFDLIFIDGDHSYKTAKTDLVNCRKLAHKDTIVIMDDTMTELGQMQQWNIGPNIAWMEGQKEGFVEPLGAVNFSYGRGHSWGRYVV